MKRTSKETTFQRSKSHQSYTKNDTDVSTIGIERQSHFDAEYN